VRSDWKAWRRIPCERRPPVPLRLRPPLFGSRQPSRPVGVVTLFGTFPAEEAVAHGERVAAVAQEMRSRLGPLFDGIA
jgi:hypothetical protein